MPIPPASDMHAFDDIAPSLKTGDIMVAHGDSQISHLIEFLNWSEWSHSGMVVRASDVGLSHLGVELLLWESTRSTVLPDIVTGNFKNGNPKQPGGVFLVDLRARIESAMHIGETPVAFRQLQYARSPQEFAPLTEVLSTTRDALFPADKDFLDLFLRGRHNKPPHSFGEFFCSELVAYTLNAMGVLERNFVPNYYLPKSYSTENRHGLPLADGATLGEQVWVNRLSA